MSFFEQLKKDIGITDMQLVGGYRIVDFCGKAIYVDGFKRVSKISSDEIILIIGKSSVHIKGELFVDYLTENSVLISGKIVLVEKVANG